MQHHSALRRILFVRTDRMGDLLMSLPAIHAVRRAFPQAETQLLLQKELAPLLEGHPDLDRLLPFEPKQASGWSGIFRTARRLRRERFDAVIVMNPTRLFHAASFLAGIPLRIGYRRKLGLLLTRSLPDTKASRDLHESQYNLELVGLLGIPAPEGTLRLPARQEAEAEARQLLAEHRVPDGQPVIAVHPWTSNPAKSWPLDSFWRTVGVLRKGSHPLLLIGQSSPEEAGRGSIPAGLVDLTDKTPLAVLPSLLRRCAALLSNDSGPVHIAAAVGTPVVVVAPREHARQLERWKPLGPGHRILIDPTVEQAAQAVNETLRAGRPA